jgi:tetratricopeptide (TPR) repeat protein
MATNGQAPEGSALRRCGEILAALAWRRVAALAPQPADAAKREHWAEDSLDHCPPHVVAGVLSTALNRTWLCVEIILAGEDLWARLKTSGAGEGDWRRLRALLDAASFNLGFRTDAEARRRTWRALHAARQLGLLGGEETELENALSLAAGLNAPLDGGGFQEEEWRQLERLGEILKHDGHGDLRPILEMRWPGREPLLVVLAAAFCRQALRRDNPAVANGAVPGLLDNPPEPGLEEVRELANLLESNYGELADWLEAVRVPAGGRANGADDAATARLERGVGHLQRGEYERAAAEFTAALRLDPTLADAYANRGEAYRLAGDYEQALADYDNAHLIEPTNARILFNRGMVHWILGQVESAIADYSACLRLDASNALAWTNRGSAHADKGDLTSALADFSRALQLDPSSPLAYQKRADVYVRKGDHDRAIADYNQAVRLNPFDALSCIKRGDAFRSKGQYDRALADYSAALRLDPLNVNAYLNRASAYRMRGQGELALADLGQAIRLEPGNARLWFERALTHRDQNNLGLALADFNRALLLTPDDADLVFQRGCTHQLAGDLGRALDDFNVAIRLRPDLAVVYYSRGGLHVGRDELDDGIADFDTALRFAPDFTAVYLSRASAWTKKGRFDNAIRDCDEALKRDPNLGGAYVVRGSARVQQGIYDEAIADFTRALQIDAENAQAYHLRGLAEMKQGDFDKALADFGESLKRNPNNARALFLRGTVYQQREQHDEALADFHQAVLLDPQYTAAYCNQRALLHAARGDYELALADYAIVLQLDETNVTALLGREQALQALKDRPPAPPEPSPPPPATTAPAPSSAAAPVRARRKKRPKTDEHLPAQTHVGRSAKDTDVFPAIQVLPPPADTDRTEEIAAEALIDRPVEAPALPGETAPDRAVPPPGAKSDGDFLLEPRGEADKPQPVGPMEARTIVQQKQEETSERAKLWAEMRFRERVKQEKVLGDDGSDGSGFGFSGPGRLVRRILVVTIALAIVSALGYGVYALMFANRDTKVEAAEVWKQYEENNDGANQKYKGKFVRVWGKLKIYTANKSTQLLFEPPQDDAKWHITFSLPKDMKDLKNGQDLIVRGRFMPRKKDANLSMSNCSLVKEK